MGESLWSFNLVIAAFGNLIGSAFQYGWACSVMNGLEEPLKNLFTTNGVSVGSYDWDLANSLTQGLWCIGGAVGAVISGPMAAKLGRKPTLLINNFFVLTGAVLQAIPFQIPEEDWGEGNPAYWAKYDLIIAGRFINGIGCGVATCVSPMMLTEIAPLPLRGLFGTQYQFLLVIGMLICWSLELDEAMLPLDSGLNRYTFLLGLPIVFGLIQMAILPFCYDSPGYLLGVDKEKAKKAAKWYKLEIDEDYVAPKTPSLSEVISDPLFYRPCMVGVCMMLSQQLSGINAIMFYSTKIFLAAGLDEPKKGTVFVGIINVIFSGVCVVLIERFGRKTLHLIGLIGMFAMATSVGVTMGICGEEEMCTGDEGTIPILSSVFVLIFVAFFQCGPGPIPMFIASELFDDLLRPNAVAIAALVNWLTNALIGFTYPILDNAIGGYTFFIFGGFCFISVIYTIFYVPETKGKEISDIQRMFMSNPPSARNSFDGIEAGKENKAFEKDTENHTAAL